MTPASHLPLEDGPPWFSTITLILCWADNSACYAECERVLHDVCLPAASREETAAMLARCMTGPRAPLGWTGSATGSVAFDGERWTSEGIEWTQEPCDLLTGCYDTDHDCDVDLRDAARFFVEAG